MTGTVLIAGAGLAGARCAETLRTLGWRGRIVLAGDEPHPPYERPALSKQFLAGTRDDVSLRPDGFWACPGDRARARPPRVGGRRASPDGESGRRRAALGRARRRHGGAGPASRRPGRRPPPAHARRCERARRRPSTSRARARRRSRVRGDRGRVDRARAGPRRDGRGAARDAPRTRPRARRRLAARAPLPRARRRPALRRRAERVPRRRAAERRRPHGRHAAPRRRRRGGNRHRAGRPRPPGAIETDDYGRTARPGVYACGDVAAWWRPSLGRHLRVEHWTSAAAQGRAVAATICGEPTRHDEAPFFWSDQFGLRLQYLGHAERWHAVVIEGGDESFTARYVDRDGRLLAALAANRTDEIVTLRRELAA